jgi:hypothetical protein
MRILVFVLLSLFTLRSFAEEKAFTFSDIVSIVQTQKIKSVEELLPLLPKSLRTSFTLAYDSQSLQGSSYLDPRVVMFSDDAKLACTFNGESSQRGYDDFECYQYSSSTRSFEFREIEFPSSRNSLTEAEISKANMNAKGTVSCTTCHANDPRPNWEEYRNWPGFYGSVDDLVARSEGRFTATKPEIENFPKFLERAKNHDRYKSLIFNSKRNGYPYRKSLATQSMDSRPNLRFNLNIMNLLAQRNARLMEGLPRATQYLFLMAAAQCSIDKRDEQEFGIYSAMKWNEADLTGETDRKTFSYDQILKPHLARREWSAIIRAKDCPTCGQYPSKRIMGETSESFKTTQDYDYTSGVILNVYSQHGTYSMNDYVAKALMKYLTEAGDSDLTPFAKEEALDPQFIGDGYVSIFAVLGYPLDYQSFEKSCSLLKAKYRKSKDVAQFIQNLIGAKKRQPASFEVNACSSNH